MGAIVDNTLSNAELDSKLKAKIPENLQERVILFQPPEISAEQIPATPYHSTNALNAIIQEWINSISPKFDEIGIIEYAEIEIDGNKYAPIENGRVLVRQQNGNNYTIPPTIKFRKQKLEHYLILETSTSLGCRSGKEQKEAISLLLNSKYVGMLKVYTLDNLARAAYQNQGEVLNKTLIPTYNRALVITLEKKELIEIGKKAEIYHKTTKPKQSAEL